MEENKNYLSGLLKELKKPIPHQWRVQSYSKQKPQATVMAYIDARDVMDVLDAYCTYGWHREHYEVDKKVYCKVGIVMPDGSIMWRSDCGVESNQDAEKGQASDAFKRAAVNWGVGRFLYDLKIQYVSANEAKTGSNYPYPVNEQGSRIWDLTEYINNKSKSNPEPPKAKQVLEPTTEQKASYLLKKDSTQPSMLTEFTDDVKKEIQAAKTKEELVLIYNKYGMLKKANEAFEAEIKAQKIALGL